MPSITINDLPDEVSERLASVAAARGVTREDAARAALVHAFGGQPNLRQGIPDLRRARAVADRHTVPGSDEVGRFLSERRRMWGEAD